jgi:hypothetical protein
MNIAAITVKSTVAVIAVTLSGVLKVSLAKERAHIR